jgi:hypothetical protein
MCKISLKHNKKSGLNIAIKPLIENEARKAKVSKKRFKPTINK